MRRLYSPVIFLIAITLLFFYQFFLMGKLPIPSDTIIGLYHPFRDLYAKDYPRGIPFKNSLITDPVRQQYPWRKTSVESIINFELPLWNPYSAAGTPLLANMQNAVFYPLNITFLFFSDPVAWSLLIVLQMFLGSVFLFLHLRFMKVSSMGSIFGAITFSLSGFSIAWLEWNTIGHVVLWLPLILLAKEKLLLKPSFRWGVILIFAEVSAFFAGHLQTFFYILVISSFYLLARIIQMSWQQKRIDLTIRRAILYCRPFFITGIIVGLLTAILWFPLFQYLPLSARDVDQMTWQKEGWFVPWQHALQFIAPDFFGNPTTLNYWGTWNYGEFVGFIGIAPLVFALFALFFRRDRKTFFFGTAFFISIIFSFPTFFAKIPYILHIPFISTSQPTRIIFITDFSLAVLSAFGFDYFMKQKRQILYPLGFIGFIFISVWLFVIFGSRVFEISPENIITAKRNLILPTGIFAAVTMLLFISLFFQNKQKIVFLLRIIIVGLTIFELVRFGWKFTPFTDQKYLFPNTKAISFLQKQNGQFRIMTTDDRILPPNFSLMYGLQSIDAYDPLYIRRYGELIAASEREKPDISPPFGFDRIITPHKFNSKIIDLLGVKYVLSLSDITSPKLNKVFQEGETRVYENRNALPRAFFVEDIYVAKDKKQAISYIFQDDVNLAKIAVLEKSAGLKLDGECPCSVGIVKILSYTNNKVTIETKNDKSGFLVFIDSYYPTWYSTIDGKKSNIYQTDFNFRGIVIPAGNHEVNFKNSLH